jgi:biopolymer transport protein ExbD
MQLQMTPMIDVVFQLLIFFVCTTSFQALEQILPTNLVTSGGSSGADVEVDPELMELEDIVIKLVRTTGATQWQLNEQTYSRLSQVRDLLMALVKIRRDLPVILDVEATVPLGDVIDVYDLCRIVGFDRIQFAAKARALAPPSGEGRVRGK